MKAQQSFYKWTRSQVAESGISMPELIATMALTGILAAIVAPSISMGTEPLRDSSNRVSSVMKMARTRAMAQTSAYRVTPGSNNELIISRAASCDAPNDEWELASGLMAEDRKLDEGVVFSNASQNGPVNPENGWSICFNSRGIADNTLSLTLFNGKKNQSQEIQVFRGGTLQIASAKYGDGTLVAAASTGRSSSYSVSNSSSSEASTSGSSNLDNTDTDVNSGYTENNENLGDSIDNIAGETTTNENLDDSIDDIAGETTTNENPGDNTDNTGEETTTNENPGDNTDNTGGETETSGSESNSEEPIITLSEADYSFTYRNRFGYRRWAYGWYDNSEFEQVDVPNRCWSHGYFWRRYRQAQAGEIRCKDPQ